MKYLSLFLLALPLIAVTIIDDFDDGIVDSTFWSFQRSENTELAEFDGVCRMRMNVGGCGGPNVCFNTKRMRKAIVGDFDAYAVFEIVDMGDGDITPFMLIATNDCTRNRVSVGWARHFTWHTWRAETIDSTDSVWTILTSSTTPMTGGKIRLRRTGDWFYMYFWDDLFGWFPLDSIEYGVDKTVLSLHVQNQGTHEVIDAAIDSFVLECDSLWFSECEPPVPEPLCMNESIQMEITDAEGVMTSTIELTIDGMPYTLPDPLIDWDGEILTFTPAAPFAHGTMHEICLLHVEDIIGNALLDTVCYSFVTDIVAPLVSEPMPAPGDTIYEYEPTISCRVLDTYHDVDESNVRILVNRIARPYAEYDGEYLTLDMSGHGFPLRVGDSVEVCVQATDLIPRCAPNDTVLCWYFITGDSIRPEIGPSWPDSLISSCTDQQVRILATDNIGIDSLSIEIEAGGNSYSWPENMGLLGDTLVFSPDFDWEHEINTICITHLVDVWGNPPYVLPACFDFQIDSRGPAFINLQPLAGSIVSQTAPDIIFTPIDIETGVLPDSFLVTVNDSLSFVLSTLASHLYVASGDTIIFNSENAGIHLSGGQTAEVCVSAFDMPDICSPNLGDTCWSFSIAEGGPIATPILPQPDMTTSCEYSEITILVEDPDSVNWQSLEIFILDRTYTYDSPEIIISDDTLIFLPSSPFSHGQIVDVEILRLDDMLDNPISMPLIYTFIVDLFPPEALLASPEEGSIIRNSQPDIVIGLLEQFAGISEDSAIFTLNDTIIFEADNPAIDWRPGGDLEGEIVLHLSRTETRLLSGDSVGISLRICDRPDLCGSNCQTYQWFVRMESDRNCLAMPNPFSPNGDDFNPTINFQYPGQDLDPAELIVFDKRGREVFRRDISANPDGNFIPERAWDGRSSDGIDLQQGLYFYVITIYDEMICNGSITLLR